MSEKNFVKFGIKLKLFTLVLITIGLVIGIIIWQIDTQSKKSAQKTVEDSLKQSQTILNTKLESRFNDISETAFSMTRDGRILPLVFDEASATLQDLVLEFERALAFNSMFITNAEGVILARSDRPEAIGYSLAGRSKLFDDPLQGKMSKGYVVSGGQIMQMVTVPLFDNIAKDVIRGTISFSYALSPQIASEINALTQSNVDFYIFTYDENRQVNGLETSYSTLPQISKRLLEKLNRPEELKKFQSLDTASNQTFHIGDQIYKVAIKPISRYEGENLGFILAYRSETDLLEPFKEIEKSVFIIGLVCLGIALVAAWVLASRISSPIINLVSLTNDIENGKYPDSSKSERSDEIGVLHQALLRMGRGLKDKNELEGYLAEIASDIGIDFDDDELLEADMELADTPASSVDSLDDTLVDGTLSQADETLVDPTVANSNDFADNNQSSVGSDVIDGRYRLLRMLGKGTTGVAYLAYDQELDERIAIKILFSEYVTSDFAVLFKEEIKLARQITHRNILRTFDFGTSDNIFYITMEYIQGYDLSKLLSLKGSLSPHISVVMVKQICSALAAAHELGIIHRDLKPANMIINRQGVLKIMDFGLAMKVSAEASLAQPGEEGGSVQKTTVAGTPRFMAPEQFTGVGLDHRTDIYAIGIILYTLITGAPPFNASSFGELSLQHQEKEAPLLGNSVKGASKDLENIIAKALNKQQSDRFQTVADMLEALNQADY